MSDKVRVQLDFGPEETRKLDAVKEEMGLTSRVEVVKHALGLLEWVVERRKNGWELIFEKGEEQRVVVLPSSKIGEAR